MKELKLNMALLEEMIVQGDVSLKISYVVQDDIQSFRWGNKASLHPFVAYY